MPSYAAGASLINALTTVVSLKTRGQVKNDLRLAEELWDEFQTYAERQDGQGNGHGR
jgi:hypothetical protein